MANNKITQLQSLNSSSLSGGDLFPVVDIDDLSSPSGETKNISADELQGFFIGEDNAQLIRKIFNWQPSYATFLVGQAVKISVSGILELANPTTAVDAESIGLIKKIIDGVSVEVAYSGFVDDFDGTVLFLDAGGNLTSDFVTGNVYFLGSNGYLREVDPAPLNTGWISKPLFIATSCNTGIVLTYRGMVNEGDDLSSSPHSIFVHDEIQCEGFVVGDIVRYKKTDEVGSEWKLASADSLDKAEMVGVISEIATTYYKISLTGYIDTLCGLIPGETYYISPEVENVSLNLLGWDINRDCQRNAIPVSPVCPYFSHPAYIAVSETEAVIINQRTLPNQLLGVGGSDCDGGGSGQFIGGFDFGGSSVPSDIEAQQHITFLFPTSIPGDTALVYWTLASDPLVTRTKYDFEFQNGFWNIVT